MSDGVDVLTVPDPRLDEWEANDAPAGTLVFVKDGEPIWTIGPAFHAALLRALIAQAGGVEARIVRDIAGGFVVLRGGKAIPEGPVVLLPLEAPE